MATELLRLGIVEKHQQPFQWDEQRIWKLLELTGEDGTLGVSKAKASAKLGRQKTTFKRALIRLG